MTYVVFDIAPLSKVRHGAEFHVGQVVDVNEVVRLIGTLRHSSSVPTTQGSGQGYPCQEEQQDR